MKKLIFLLAIVAIFLVPSLTFARGGGHSGGHHSTSHSSGRSHSRAVPGVPRDSHGRIKRSEATKREFMKETGHPNGNKGQVVDHIIPLKRGGPDTPSNMQWQTKEAAKVKDKVE